MDHKHFQTMFEYNYWAHRLVWDCAMHLTDEQFGQHRDYSIGSVHQQFVHIMSVESLWFSRLHGESPTVLFNIADYPTREAVRSKWDEIEGNLRGYLGQLQSNNLMQIISYKSIKGVSHRMTVIGILSHVINHGTDHRAQILPVLYDLGAPTVEQDMIYFLLERDLE